MGENTLSLGRTWSTDTGQIGGGAKVSITFNDEKRSITVAGQLGSGPIDFRVGA